MLTTPDGPADTDAKAIENRDFCLPHAFDAPVRGPRRNIAITFGRYEKTRKVWLHIPYGDKF